MRHVSGIKDAGISVRPRSHDETIDRDTASPVASLIISANRVCDMPMRLLY